MWVDSYEDPSRLEITIKATKTDPFCQGFTIHLGATCKSLCPVASLFQFMALLGGEPGPLFKWKSGKYLTRAKFVASLRKALSAAGYDERKFAGHSFRIGAASTPAQCRLEDSLIKTLYRKMGKRGIHQVHQDTATDLTISSKDAYLRSVTRT